MILAWALGPAPFPARLAPVLLLALGLWAPVAAVVALATFAPICGLAGVVLDMDMPGVRLLEQLGFATIAAAMIRARWTASLRLLWPGVCLALVVVASALVVQPVWLLTFEIPASWDELLGLIRDVRVFDGAQAWQPTTTAMRMLMGIGVAIAAEASLRDRPTRLPAVIAAFGAGSALAAGHNLWRLVQLNEGAPAGEILRALAVARINTQTDVNAGGSLFALAVLSLIGLLHVPGPRRWWPAPMLALVAVGGLWLSGSRSAMAAALVALLVGLAARALHRRADAGWRVLAAAGVVMALSAGAVAMYPSTRNFSLSASVESRKIFAATAVNMWLVSPVDGVGVGTFYGRSADYGAADADKILITGHTQENAHNYPLQILAELGLLGLLPYLLLAVPPIWHGLRGSSTALARWLAAGLAAYLASSLTGHPQLLSETVVPFWIVLGGLAASLHQAGVTSARIGMGVAAGLVVLTSGTHAIRAERARDIALLEHRGIGLSRWQSDEDGHRFRVGDSASLAFVPTGATVSMPFTVEGPAGPPVEVRVLIDGQEVNRLIVAPGAPAVVQLSIRPSRRRYVDLRLTGAPGVTFRLGRIDAKRLE